MWELWSDASMGRRPNCVQLLQSVKTKIQLASRFSVRSYFRSILFSDHTPLWRLCSVSLIFDSLLLSDVMWSDCVKEVMMIKNRAKYFRQPYLANLGCGRTLQGLRAVGALFRGARCIHIDRLCFRKTPPSFRSRESLLWAGGTHSVWTHSLRCLGTPHIV